MLFQEINEIAPNALSAFLREYESTKCPLPIGQYPDAALRGLILEWLQDYMDLDISELVANDLWKGKDLLINSLIELEKEYIIK